MRQLPVYLSIACACLILTFGFSNCSRVGFKFDAPSELASQLSANGGGIVINNGAAFTNKAAVQLALVTGNGQEMYVTNVPNCEAGGQWEPYKEFRSWTLVTLNGTAKVYVKYRETKTSTPSDCFEDAIVHDDVAPLVNITPLSGYTNNANVSFEIMASDNLSGVDVLDCKADAAWPTACQAGIKVHMLSEGNHSVRVFATDKAGNISDAKQSALIVDLTPPTIVFNQVPPKLTSDSNPTFAFVAQDALSGVDRYECKLGAMATWQTCTSPFTKSFPAGANEVSVRAYDKAGNMSPEISYTWIIDQSAPSVRIVSGPSPLTNQVMATLTFDGMDDGQPITKFECSLDNAAFASCVSPAIYNGLSDGNHTFAVRGYDTVGNLSAPATYSWVVDTAKPTVKLVTTPSNPTRDTSAGITFTATDTGSGVKETQCSLDGGSYGICMSPANYSNLAEGSHTFSVRAIDNAGNIGNPVSYTWRIDLTKPVVTIVSGPAPFVSNMNATLAFTADDGSGGAIDRTECLIDTEVTFTTCTSPKSYMGLAEGAHVFQVRAYDTAGNVSDIKLHAWFIDTLPPAINYGQFPASSISPSTPANIQFSVSDAGVGVQSVMCGLDGALAACQASEQKSFSNLALGEHTFRVQATDKLGNTSVNVIAFKVEIKTQDYSQSVTVNRNNKADVLVVIDNSGSMKNEQANMAARFGTFLDKLSGLDWQVGIVTTDVQSYSSSSSAARADGRFLQMANSNGVHILNSAMDPTIAGLYFATTIQRPSSEGSGNEQGIAATYRAIQRAVATTGLAENAPNRAFFRSGAVLSVIVVTDADETNPNGTQTQNKPSELVNLIKTSFPGKAFKYNSIIVKPGDSSCLVKDGNEGYGYAYDTLSKLTGGVIGTVCSQDYGSQLASIGQATVDLVNSVDLNCAPLDTNGDGKADVQVVAANGTTIPSFTVSGLKVTFSSALPAGAHQFNYRCLVP